MAATNGPETPRQKMINLMYLMLTAMLALNVSSDVLNGFSLVEQSLLKTTTNASLQNNALYAQLKNSYEQNPEKVKAWYDKAEVVRLMSDSLFNYAESLKERVVKEADGDDGDIHNIKRTDDVDASNRVMLAEIGGEGKKLYNAINNYRETILKMVDDTVKQALIKDNLSTEVGKRARKDNKNWQQSMFENMPVAATVTLLTKLQNDIRNVELEVVHTLVNNIDVGDFRVNKINAYVIPNSRVLIRGGKYSAQLVLSAEDSTQQPRVFVGGKELPSAQNGHYETVCGSTGKFTLKGFIEMTHGDGSTVKREFSDEYTVIEPTATVSPTLVNVLYAGIDNPLEISVPGVPQNQVTAAIANGNGTLVHSGNVWVVKPQDIGKECIIAVTAQMNGRNQLVENKKFRVRALPKPLPFVVFNDEKGTMQRYKGERALSKRELLSSDGIIAALDDDFLDVTFRVLDFETTFIDSMGDASLERAEGAKFTDRMKERFRRMSKGSRFFISKVRAVGPDGVEQQLPSIEVIIN